MGNKQSSTNDVKSTIDQTLAILNRTTQNCRTIDNATINTGVHGSRNVNRIGNTNRLTIKLDDQCALAALQDTKTSQTMKQALEQMAKNVSQNISARVGDSSKSKNIERLVNKLTTNIKSEYESNCIHSYNQTIDDQIVNSENVNVRDNENELTMAVTSKCLSNSTNVVSAAQDLQQALDQSGANTEENTIAGILSALFSLPMIIAMVMVVIIIVIGPKLIPGMGGGESYQMGPDGLISTGMGLEKKLIIAGSFALVITIIYFLYKNSNKK